VSRNTQILLLVLLFGFAGGFLFHRMKISKNRVILNERREEHRALQVQINEAKAVAAQVEKFREQVRKVELQWKQAQQMLPQEEEIPSLLKSIAESGVRQNVEILLFQKNPASPQEHYTEIPVQLQVSGGYHDIGRFLSAIGNLPRIVNVSNIRIDPVMEEMVKVSFSATTYTLASASAAPKKPPKKPKEEKEPEE